MSGDARGTDRAGDLRLFHVLTRSREPVIVAAMATSTTTLGAHAATAPTSLRRMASVVGSWVIEAAT